MNKTRESDSIWKLEISLKRKRSIEDRKEEEERGSSKGEKNSSWVTAFFTSVGTLVTGIASMLADIESPGGSGPGHFFWFGSVLASVSMLLMIVAGLLWWRSVRAQQRSRRTAGADGYPAGGHGRSSDDTNGKRVDVKKAGESIEEDLEDRPVSGSPSSLAEGFACREGGEDSQLKHRDPPTK